MAEARAAIAGQDPAGGSRVDLNAAARRSLIAHAEAAYPEECCGALLGRRSGWDATVTGALPFANILEMGREHGHLASPRELIAAEHQAAARDLEVVGVYHSHPGAAPRPSRRDLELAVPGWCYLLLAVRAGRLRSMASWRLREDLAGFARQVLTGAGQAPWLP